ncbi:hypothetical protein Syun_008317 [Stephania yunnanensis]|uniref:Uncharacterized protein n=1 Tax=Stephania yunnanensis TaxID=152371 RepID=A0AAP0PMF1_9MAGN
MAETKGKLLGTRGSRQTGRYSLHMVSVILGLKACSSKSTGQLEFREAPDESSFDERQTIIN